MGTLVSGTPATVYVPVASTITITPGTGGKVSLNGRNAAGDPVTPMEIYSATSVTLSAGSTISLLAEGGAATYTDPAGLDTSIQALVSGAWQVSSLYPAHTRGGLHVSAGSDISMSIRRKQRNGGMPLTSLRARLANWYITTSMVETAGSNDIRIAYSIEYPIGTVPRSFTLNGSAQFVVRAGDTVDALELSGLVLPANAQYYEHIFVEGWIAGAQGGVVPFNQFHRYYPPDAGPTSIDRVAFGGTTNNTTVSPGETANRASPANVFGPLALLGQAVPGSMLLPCPVICGDSITYGFNEHNAMSGDANGNAGPWGRWLGTYGVGMLNFSISSMAASGYINLSATNTPRTLSAVRDVGTHVLLALGRNDMGGTVSGLVANIESLAATWKAAGKKVGVATVTPYVNTSDAYATLANQSPQNAGQEVTRLAYNQRLRSSLPANVSYLIDLADQFESSRDSGKFKVNGSANYATTDGLHPTGSLNAVAAAGLPAPTTVFV
jgi:GDSL-like Lipase/Acylhydrolase family